MTRINKANNSTTSAYLCVRRVLCMLCMLGRPYIFFFLLCQPHIFEQVFQSNLCCIFLLLVWSVHTQKRRCAVGETCNTRQLMQCIKVCWDSTDYLKYMPVYGAMIITMRTPTRTPLPPLP